LLRRSVDAGEVWKIAYAQWRRYADEDCIAERELCEVRTRNKATACDEIGDRISGDVANVRSPRVDGANARGVDIEANDLWEAASEFNREG